MERGGYTETKGIVYFTCLTHRIGIEDMCRVQLAEASRGMEIVSVSRGSPIVFGRNYVVHSEPSALTMHRQILKGLRESTVDVIYLCENDVLYHSSHFDFWPEPDAFWYNTNVWKVRYPDGLAVWADDTQQVSGLCAYRETLLDFYTQRVAQLDREGANRHYEPGLKQSVGCMNVQNRLSAYPNLCIRHDKNLTKSKWSPSDFRNPQYARGWREAYEVSGWGDTRDLFEPVLA